MCIFNRWALQGPLDFNRYSLQRKSKFGAFFLNFTIQWRWCFCNQNSTKWPKMAQNDPKWPPSWGGPCPWWESGPKQSFCLAGWRWLAREQGRLQGGATIHSTWRGFGPTSEGLTSWADSRGNQFWGGGNSKLIDSKKCWKGIDQNPYKSDWKDTIKMKRRLMKSFNLLAPSGALVVIMVY